MKERTGEMPKLSTKRMHEFTLDEMENIRSVLLKDPNVISIDIPDQYEGLRDQVQKFDYEGSYGKNASLVRNLAFMLLDYILSPIIFDRFSENKQRRLWEKGLFASGLSPDFCKWLSSNKLALGYISLKVLMQFKTIIEIEEDEAISIVGFPKELVTEALELSTIIKEEKIVGEEGEITFETSVYEEGLIKKKIEIVDRVEALALAAIKHILS